MATFDEIKEVRLRIQDPAIFVNIVQVANEAALPTEPVHQTAYRATDTTIYYSTQKKESDFPLTAPDDYDKENLYVSDARLSVWIDSLGTDKATCQALKNIIGIIGKEMGLLKKNTSGSEVTEYTTLKEWYDYYKGLLDLCNDNAKDNAGNSTGKVGAMKAPEIAGGNL